jgi:hypothetical protein
MSDTSTAIAPITIAFISRQLVFYAFKYMHFHSTIIVEGRCKNMGKLSRWSSTLSAAPSIDISRVVRGEERSMLPHDVSRHLLQREGVPCGYW